jgi:YcaO-like protein with predicted kinase domain
VKTTEPGLPPGHKVPAPEETTHVGRDYRRGTRRLVDPTTTLNRIQPLLRSMGITRIANVTGLDIIGLPVVTACRPNSRSNAVFQGKGLDVDAAKASAVMEAIETYCAERPVRPLLLGNAADLSRRYTLADVAKLPRLRRSNFTDGSRILWIEGHDLIERRSFWLPYEIVNTDFTLPHPVGSGHFVQSTNGLASGNDWHEAVCHALCELIERDATVLFLQETNSAERRRLDLGSIDDAESLAVLDRFAAARMHVAVWDITSDLEIAAFRCHIMEQVGGPGLLPLVTEGHGCHPDRRIALQRALLEAAQARVTLIVGTRDDVGPEAYGRSDDPNEVSRWRELLASSTAARRFSDIPSHVSTTVAGDVELLYSRLHKAGFQEVIAVDLSPPGPVPFSVVRMVVPGLEGPPEASVLLGHRALNVRSRNS